MQQLKIQSKRETEEIIRLVKTQWGSDIELDYAVLKNNEDKIFLASKDLFTLDFEDLKINSIGMYFGEILKSKFNTKQEIRLSIEGSQLVGPSAKINVIELDDEQSRNWLRGNEIDMELDNNGFVIIKHGEDFLGSGKSMGSRILNYVPKGRRITCVD